MEDNQIVALYWQRNERAISATAEKYGRYCFQIAYRILASREDADESVNDTYMSAWEHIPPSRPAVLSTFLGKITRWVSLNRVRSQTRQKRGGGEVALALEELGECVADKQSVEQAVEMQELTLAIQGFLRTLPEEQRDVFVCRYWFLAPVQEIARKFSYSESKVKSMLHRTRMKLKAYLQEEGLL